MSENEQKADTIKLNEHIQATKKEIIRLWEDRENNDISLREHIRKLASQVEETGTPTKLVSTEVIRMFGQSGTQSRLQRYISETLDSKYKRTYTSDEIVQGGTNSIEECSITAEEITEALKKAKTLTPEELGRRGFQDVVELAYEIKNKYENTAEDYGIPLSYQKASLGEESKDNKITLKAALESPDERIRILAEYIVKELEGFMQILGDDKEDITERHYISDNPDIAEGEFVGLKATKLLLRPYDDKKWQRDWLEWCDIIQVYFESGGTRASGFSATDISGIINEKTGQPVKRKVTKEQIDAKYLQYLNDMRFIIVNHPNIIKSEVIKNIVYGIDLQSGKLNIKRGKELTKEQLEVLYKQILDAMRWLINNWIWLKFKSQRYRDKEEGYRARRAYDLHDKLSDAA